MKIKKYIDNKLNEAAECNLDDIANSIHYNGPTHRGASLPPFDKYKINQSRIPDNTRIKDLSIYYVGSDTILVNWITQEPFNTSDASAVVIEAERAIRAVASREGYTKKFYVETKIICRDGKEYGYWFSKFAINDSEEEIKRSPRDGKKFRKLIITDESLYIEDDMKLLRIIDKAIKECEVSSKLTLSEQRELANCINELLHSYKELKPRKKR